MRRVRIVKNWDWPDLLRQTPGGKGIWKDILFSTQPLDTCDYLVILNCPPSGTTIRTKCHPDNIWALMQEPPNEWLKPMHVGIPQYKRIYNLDPSLQGDTYRLAQPALPWHIDKSYDELVSCAPQEKVRILSWITSNAEVWVGHKARMAFLEKLRDNVPFDLYGRGFRPIVDKWDGLAPYRYALAVENFQNPYYWSEKIADCYLAWTMPIYYGCSRITEYFPPESMVLIDIDAPDVMEKILEAISSDRWLKNRDAVAYARDLVLNKYQLFPFLVDEIAKERFSWVSRFLKKNVEIEGYNFIPPTQCCH